MLWRVTAATPARAGGGDHTAITVPMFHGGRAGGDDGRKMLGDATDVGLLRYCDRLAPSSLLRMAYKKVRAPRTCTHARTHAPRNDARAPAP